MRLSWRNGRNWLFGFALSFLGLPVCFAAESDIDPLDWPYWRGPEQNGISRELGLVDKWSPKGENLLWSNPEAGGRSTPIVLRGKLYTLVRNNPGTPTEGEKVICLDAATGKKIWENAFNVFLSDVPDTRVGWSSVVGDPVTGHVYALGVCGYFQCMDGETGKTLWSHSLSEEFGLLSTYGGRTNFPILFDDVVIISAVMIGWGEHARPNHRFIGFDKATGKPIWFNATRPLPDDTTYSSPVIGVFKGQALLVVGAGDGFLYAMQPRNGQIVWKYNLSRRGVNCTPLVTGDNVFATQSEENPNETSMGAVALLKAVGKGDVTESATIWKNKEWMVGRAAPLLLNDRLYLVDDGAGLFIANPKTGELIHKQKLGTMQRASPLYADGKIYTCDVNGRWFILKPTEKGVDVVHKLRLAGETHSSPIVSHGRIYVQTTESLFCIGKKAHEVKATTRPEPTLEDPVGENEEPAFVQVVPVEALIRPGEKVTFETRAYNAKGRPLGVRKASYVCTKGGVVSDAGEFTSNAEHAGILVTATVGTLKSEGRVRVVPDLPWSFDFSDGEVPISWIGARYRHIIRDVDGNKLMVKVTTIPKGTRSQAWMGHTDFHDYTIQADLRGSIKDGKIPDMGVIAQRYTLDMMGASQQLQIRTWPPTLRAAKTIPFTWKPNVWYTVKLRAANEGDKAVLRGKVWERDQTEPADWTIVAEDPSPNRIGSPGLFGNATNAEIFVDNVKVYPNGK